ncbi:PDZ domain-containing protein [Candidatus Poriferisodalis sp.]|uniref:YlbL family protein n=1 Tax=Candidatus Poriferisodalis sp. TaxID=3101277 RepID=UPI003B519879
MTDASGRPPPDDPDDRPAEDEADLGWRALAGSLDDLGFTPRAVREAVAGRTGAVPTDTGPTGPAAADLTADPAADPAAGPTDPDPADPAAGPAADPAVGHAADPADPAADPDPADPDDPYADPDVTASGHPRARQFSRGSIGLIITMLALSILIGGGFSYQLYDKAVIAPGGTADIEDFVDIADHPAYASEASISLVSVRTSFAPSLFEVIGGWLDGALEVVDLEDILGERTVAENREAGRLQMDQSTQIAVAVALEHLGYEIMSPIGARIERIVVDAPAHEALHIGDIVQRVDGTAITTAKQLSDTIKANEPGAETTLTALDPDGQLRDVTVTLADRDGVALLGVLVTTHVEFEELPIDVTLNIENIGGPSAGLAFTLSVIDALTPEPLTGNLDIAATGTIHHDGTVGPIGGVPQKSHAVVRAGTDLFLVPASQVEQAVAVAEPSVSVVGVETLEEALAAIEAHQS